MNFFISFIIISLILVQVSPLNAVTQHQRHHRRILLYKINDEQSIYIIDKMNKIAVFVDTKHNNIKNNDQLIDFKSKNELQQQHQQRLTLLNSNSNYMLIGGINRVYNVSLNDLNEYQIRSDWSIDLETHSKTIIDCTNNNNNNNNNLYQCFNYIKVGVPLLNESLLITCGTNMNKPFCRKQQQQSDNFLANFPLPQMLQSCNQKSSQKPFNTQNIPAFDYAQSIYFFHSQLPSQDVYKQKYISSNGDVQFTELIKTPIGAIKSKLFIILK